MRSAWRGMAVASLSIAMLLSGSASLAAGPDGAPLPDLWPALADPVIERRIDAAAPHPHFDALTPVKETPCR